MKVGFTKFIVLILLGTGISCRLFSQGVLPAEKQIPNILSPEAASLGKFGAYNVNYYTGSPNISIPIHEINESGVQIPIVLTYDASGFVPNKGPGLAGMNWNLFA